MNMGNVSVSERGMMLIGNAEGYVGSVYLDPVGIPTAGIGHTHQVRKGMEVTIERSAKWFEQDLREAEVCVGRFFNGAHMTQGQYDAMVSAVFNMGCSRLRLNGNGSHTQIYKFARQREFVSMCNQLPRWDKAGGKALPGLTKRRGLERDLCLSAESV